LKVFDYKILLGSLGFLS